MKKFCSVLLALCMTLSLAVPASALELEDAKRLLQAYYVDEIPEEILSLDSLDEILTALGDPYTAYLTAEDYQQLLTIVNGESVTGIGVSIQKSFSDGYIILSVLPDSPALDAGLEAGDVIIAVDGVTLTAAADPTAFIRGEEGTPVSITLRRADGHTQELTLTRRTVAVPIVTYRKLDNAGYIDCSSFGSSTAGTIRQALEELDGEVSIWIMDLRANPGGTASAAANAAGMFVGSQLMSSFRDSDGAYSYTLTRADCPDLTDKPLIILTSPYSASGSELFSGAIRDHGAGIALGQRSYGKGVAQQVLDSSSYPELFTDDGFKITTYRFFSPDGATNDTVGIIPYLMVSIENTAAAALLLSAQAPAEPTGFLRLSLAGNTLYVDMKAAMEEENLPAFVELLEALPPSALLEEGGDGGWRSMAPDVLAEKLGLDFHPRTFSDIRSSAFFKAINTLAVYQILGGYGDGTFRPQQNVTRAEFCAMVSTALNLPETNKAPAFSDVSSDAWYAGVISAMVNKGFLSGYGDGTFRPEQNITYQEMVAVLDNVAAWACTQGYRLARYDVDDLEAQQYAAFRPWAQKAARNLDELGALVGDGYATDAPGTRELAAGLLCATMQGIGLLWDEADGIE